MHTSLIWSLQKCVCIPIFLGFPAELSHLRRPIYLYSPRQTPRPGEGFRTLCSLGITSKPTFLHALFRLYRTNTDSVRKLFGCSASLSPSAEYVTGDRFSPEFMEKRRLECVSGSLFVLTRSFGSGSTGSYNAYRATQHCNGVHSSGRSLNPPNGYANLTFTSHVLIGVPSACAYAPTCCPSARSRTEQRVDG